MAAQIGTPYNGPMGPDQNRCHVGPTIHFDRPRAGTPAPRLIGFPVGPPVSARLFSRLAWGHRSINCAPELS
jgi:hypothetical protein